MKIYKYVLENDVNTLEVPPLTEFIKLGYQTEGFVIWAMVEPNVRTVKRLVILIATGMDVPDPTLYAYLDTLQTPTGFVFHAFVDLEG